MLLKLNRLSKAIPFIVSLGFVIFILKRIGISRFALVSHQISLLSLLVALLIDAPFVFLKSHKWYRIARMAIPEMRFSGAMISFLIGLGVSLLTPAQLGELARAVTFRTNRRRVFILTFVDKLVDLAALGLLFVISIIFLRWSIGIMLWLSWLIAMIGITWWACGLRISKLSMGNRKRLLSTCLLFSVSQFMISIVCFTFLMLQFYAILLDFADIRFSSVVIGLPLITVAEMLPIAIGGIGLRETVASAILPRFGIGAAQAAVASFLLFVVNGLVPGLIGIILGWNRILAHANSSV